MSIDGETTTLGEVLGRWGGEVKTGPFGTTLKASEYSKDGVPVISVGEIGYGNLQLGERTPRVGTNVTDRLPEYLLRHNDIVFARKGSVDRTAIVKADQTGWFLGSDGIRLRLPENVCPQYVRYWIISPEVRNWLQQQSTGSTMASLNQSIINRLPIRLPLIQEQQAIAAVLGALDDKIDLNRRMNQTLEAMARALFRSWFVDFDPVCAKAEGRAPSHTDPATSALFPARFGEDGLPEGWREAGLDEIATFLNGLALQKYPSLDGEDDLPVIKIAELRSGVTDKSGRASAALPSKYIIKDGDVLFSWSGSLTQKVWSGGDGALNQHLFKVSSDRFPRWFHYYAVDLHMESFRAVAASKATTMGHIQRHHLSEAKVAVPDASLMRAADAQINPLFELAVKNDLQSRTLASLRDTLLPKLMSGELRVRKAECALAEVA